MLSIYSLGYNGQLSGSSYGGGYNGSGINPSAASPNNNVSPTFNPSGAAPILQPKSMPQKSFFAMFSTMDYIFVGILFVLFLTFILKN